MRLAGRLFDYALAAAAFVLSTLADAWLVLRPARRCDHNGGATPGADGVYCALCGRFMRWHDSARCGECGAFL